MRLAKFSIALMKTIGFKQGKQCRYLERFQWGRKAEVEGKFRAWLGIQLEWILADMSGFKLGGKP